MNPGAPDCWILNAERYPDGARVHVRIRHGRIAEICHERPGAMSGAVLDACGGALLPGLYDHHIHLLALAAARGSVVCGPPSVTTPIALARALAGAPGIGWLRGVGYHESVAGLLDRRNLDALAPDRPVRIQHASGKAWLLNSAAIAALALDRHAHLDGVECDGDGAPTGRLFRLDDWLRERLGAVDPPDLAEVSAELARYGVTGVTDTSASNDDGTAALFRQAIEQGALRQRVRMMGGEGLTPGQQGDRLCGAELKILLDEDRLPDLDELVECTLRAHAAGRGVAFHCVSRTELVYALHVLGVAGSFHDRIEHAAVAAPDLFPMLRASGVTVVTQPGFVLERGDRYLADAEAGELPHLYRLSSWLAQGIPLGLSSDAPYGDPDPWAAMRAAVARRTRAGVMVDAGEALTPEAALGGFLTSADRAGGAIRALLPGSAADLCLLDRPWREARRVLEAAAVRMTMIAGEVCYERG